MILNNIHLKYFKFQNNNTLQTPRNDLYTPSQSVINKIILYYIQTVQRISQLFKQFLICVHTGCYFNISNVFYTIHSERGLGNSDNYYSSGYLKSGMIHTNIPSHPPKKVLMGNIPDGFYGNKYLKNNNIMISSTKQASNLIANGGMWLTST